MLAADRVLLDAHLRNELQQLRRLEITNVVNRYQSALTPATLIAGFSMVGMSALDFTSDFQLDPASKYAEPVFYLCAAGALASALYVTAVSTIGIVFGQRLTIQATAEQGYDHDKTVSELNQKFLFSLIALGVSMVLTNVAALAVIFVKDPTTRALALTAQHQAAGLSEGVFGNYLTPVVSTALGGFFGLCTLFSIAQMYFRLDTPTPASSDLKLRTAHGKSVADAQEFFVAGEPESFGRRR